MKSVNDNTCGFENELLSYLYEDGSADSREKFEFHLADCGICTDEFAAISLARFSVYEWHKEEFVPMETPQILIPYEEPRVSIWNGIREAFSFNWANASLAAAGLLVVATLGAVFLSNTEVVQEVDLAGNSNTVSVTGPSNAEPSKPLLVDPNDVVAPAKASVEFPPRRTRPERTAQSKREIRPNQPAVRNEVKPSTVATTRDRRSLDAIDDDTEDDSLRLSDLLDAEDTRL
ncbi:MAG TPA: hypothetical protein PKA82_10475 [Pyrinomonadaceae bacterium]|nr:hypothetical protein [Pyrinomonadaceae bacterium]